jgi:hypothetical protein
MCRGKLYYEKASVRRGEGVDRQVGECVGYGEEMSGLTAVTD